LDVFAKYVCIPVEVMYNKAIHFFRGQIVPAISCTVRTIIPSAD